MNEREGERVYLARHVWPVVAAICFAILGLIFGLYEIVERTWLQHAAPSTLHLLHILRGIGSAVLVGSVITWYLVRKRIPRLSDSLLDISAGPTRESFSSPEQGSKWFIKLRWIAFVFVTISVFISTAGMGLIVQRDAWVPLYACVLLIGVSNVIFSHPLAGRVSAHFLLVAQVVTDIVLLTGLLHFSGGIENPFFFVYIFHIIIASILLQKREAYWLTLLVCVLFSLLALAEATGLIFHYTLEIYPRNIPKNLHAAHSTASVVVVLSVFAGVAFGTAYFATSVSEALRVELKKEKETALMLLQAAKMAAIGELAGNIAHEVNNPIGIILGKAKLLLSDFKDQVPARVARDLEKIDRHAERVAGIVRGLLSFSRPSTQEKESIEIGAVIEDSLSLVDARLRADNIVVKVSLAERLPRIVGNFNDLQQVIINLANNAADAMPGGGELSISARPFANRMNERTVEGVEVKVSDTGKGISSDNIERVFTPFFTTKEAEGTGLGLAIVQGIIKDHGGKIGVESVVGKRTTFKIFLPGGEE